ncbi:MAG: SDR family oxidoreductase [Opitutus sp.]
MADITREAEIAAALGAVVQRHGQVSLLLNSVGLLCRGRVDEMSEAGFDPLMGVYVKGVWLATKHTGSHLRRAGVGTAFVNLTGVSAYIGSEVGFAYTVSKGAVASVTRSIAQGRAADGTKFNAIVPDDLDAGFTLQTLADSPDPTAYIARANSLHVLGRIGRPEEIAQEVVFLASARASTGTVLLVDGAS